MQNQNNNLEINRNETINNIINQATILFNQNGYDGTSISDIATQANVSKGILYHYFKNKDAIYLYCLVSCNNQMISYIKENCTTQKLKLLDLVNLSENFFTQYPAYQNLYHDIFLDKPQHLLEEIKKIRQTLQENAKRFISNSFEPIKLGKGVSQDDIVNFVLILSSITPQLLASISGIENKDDQQLMLDRLYKIFFNGVKKNL